MISRVTGSDSDSSTCIIKLQRRVALANTVTANNFDVLCLCETWLTPEMKDAELFLPNYTFFRSERSANISGSSRHGGVLIGLQSSFNSSQLHLPSKFDGSCAACVVSVGTERLGVVCCYFPPNISPYALPSDDVTELFDIFKGFRLKNLIICGDFNFPHIDWADYSTSCQNEATFINAIEGLNLEQHVDFPTTASNTIDLFLTAGCIDVIDISSPPTLLSDLSDHVAILAVVSLPSSMCSPRLRTQSGYSYCNGDYEKMQEMIQTNSFNGICWSNVNVLLGEWYKWVDNIMSQCIPKRTMHRASLPPWVSRETSNMLKRLSTARYRYNDTHPKVLLLASQCNRLLEAEKSHYEAILSAGRSSSRLFKYFRTFQKSAIPASVFLDSDVATTQKHQAQLFSDYFSAQYIQSSPFDSSSLDMDQAYTGNLIHDFDLNRGKLELICVQLDVTKSRGPDALPPILFKRCVSLAHSLHQLLYKIKQTSVYPDAWKQSLVIPVHKKGSKADVRNYRPVSLLCIPSKILERCIFHSLYEHYRPMLNESQFGFRKHRSCTLQLLKYTDMLYRAIDAGKQFDVVYTDFEKAFDRVDHGILLRKLYSTGVRGRLFKLIQSYLTGRIQRVRIGESLSKPLTVTSGVPQGAILAALLFLVFINDLPSCCVTSLPLLAADDAKFISVAISEHSLQHDLDNVFQWTLENNIPFNVKKCSHFSSIRSPSPLFFNGMQIQNVQQQLDLGVMMDWKLNWTPHVKRTAHKAMTAFHLIRRNSPSLPVFAKLNLYKSMILPILTYSSVAIDYNVGCMRIVEGIQRKVCRWILGDCDYKDALKKLNILPIPYYLQLNDLLTLSKILSNVYDVSFENNYAYRVPHVTTRASTEVLFIETRPRLRIAEQSFWFRTLRLANRLPPTVDVHNLPGLKNRLLRLFWAHFDDRYSESNSCTWRMHCDCVLSGCRLNRRN